MAKAKVISSLEKVFIRDQLDKFSQVRTLTAARSERVSFQVLLDNRQPNSCTWATMSVRSKLGKYIKSFCVEYVPSEYPVDPAYFHGEYITTEPGIFPDVLRPMKKGEELYFNHFDLYTFWITAELPEDLEPGEYSISIRFTSEEGNLMAKTSVKLQVKNAVIPGNDIRFTQWFHCDCIADYFGVKMMSEKHWKLIDRFMATAVHTGMTMILTPLFTPPLDTAIGTERPTMQLVQIEKQGETYSFDFSLLDRWVAMAKKNGFQYYELSHLFSQWGARACPKIIVKVDGKDEMLFGWHVASDSDAYQNFLSQFLPALMERLEMLEIRENCYFHISDEPTLGGDRPDYENYQKARKSIKRFIGDNKIMDALTHVEYYDGGLVDCPIPNTDRIEAFMKRDIKERWCYYCGAGDCAIADRLFAMPSYRNRASGLQFYMNDIVGFLHWGFNFYYSGGSKIKIDPYRVTDALRTFVSGDPFTVYPYENGAIESLRAVVFYQGLQDRMLLKALEAKIGKDATKAMVLEIAGKEITFDECLNAEKLVAIHDRAIELLAD